MKQYNYSVIIPTKNIPDLLSRALNTIPQRDDVQVIIVDDNSNPEKVDFEQYPGLDRKNTQVIFNKDSLGAGHARNIGLRQAEGNWIIFLDSDDLFTENAFDLIDQHLNDSEDIVYFGITSAISEDMSPSNRHIKRMTEIEKYRSSFRQLDFYLRFNYTEPWGKMYKRSLIASKNISFDESLVANDFMFSVLTGYYAVKILYDDHILYCCTERSNSICNDIYENSDKIQSRLMVYYRAQLFFNSKKIKLYPFISLLRKIYFEKRLEGEISKYVNANRVSYWWIVKNTMSYILLTFYRTCTGTLLTSYKKG